MELHTSVVEKVAGYPIVQLFLDGSQLSNAANLVDWSESPIRLDICESCWQPGCNNGSCIELYKAGELYVLTVPPIFNYDEFELSRNAPSDTLLDSGPIVLTDEQYRIIESIIPKKKRPRSFRDLQAISLLVNFVLSQPLGDRYRARPRYYVEWLKDLEKEIVFVEGESKENIIAFLQKLLGSSKLTIERPEVDQIGRLGVYLDEGKEISSIVRYGKSMAVRLNDGFILQDSSD